MGLDPLRHPREMPMPPLFVYAIVFLSLLTVIGFVMCLREGAEAPAKAAAPEGEAPRAPLRRAAADVARPPRAPDAPRGSPDSGSALNPDLRTPSDRSIPQDGREPERPILPLHPLADALPVREAASLAGDGAALADQVAHLTQVVADLKAELRSERQGFEEEIRRLNRMVGARSDADVARSAGQDQGQSTNVRHISIRDLRVRRVS
jgi:hypothetical protein